MRALSIALAAFLLLLMPSCAGNKDKELFETAKFEELQNNPDHARALYEEITVKYPDSKYAGMAQTRLKDMGKGQYNNKR
ncbi:MAG: hypothetical protein HQK94_17540 [Nitrospirae bacterium]|nr:hypothetical protein [Nitrospirota bacterium]